MPTRQGVGVAPAHAQFTAPTHSADLAVALLVLPALLCFFAMLAALLRSINPWARTYPPMLAQIAAELAADRLEIPAYIRLPRLANIEVR